MKLALPILTTGDGAPRPLTLARLRRASDGTVLAQTTTGDDGIASFELGGAPGLVTLEAVYHSTARQAVASVGGPVGAFDWSLADKLLAGLCYDGSTTTGRVLENTLSNFAPTILDASARTLQIGAGGAILASGVLHIEPDPVSFTIPKGDRTDTVVVRPHATEANRSDMVLTTSVGATDIPLWQITSTAADPTLAKANLTDRRVWLLGSGRGRPAPTIIRRLQSIALDPTNTAAQAIQIANSVLPASPVCDVMVRAWVKSSISAGWRFGIGGNNGGSLGAEQILPTNVWFPLSDAADTSLGIGDGCLWLLGRPLNGAAAVETPPATFPRFFGEPLLPPFADPPWPIPPPNAQALLQLEIMPRW